MDRRFTGSIRRWFIKIDETNQRAIATINGIDTMVPFTWGVCSTCDGRGSHVNPSIDCNGFTSDDPDDIQDYISGCYNIPCNECRGRRVVPTPTEYQKEIQEDLDDRYETERMYAAERRMGA